MSKSRLAIKLADRLNKEFGKDWDFVCESIIKRTYVGYWQRSAGYWSWNMFAKNKYGNQCLIGSIYRATDVLKAKKLSIIKADCIGYEILIEEEFVKQKDGEVVKNGS